jgi:hypothetical protein
MNKYLLIVLFIFVISLKTAQVQAEVWHADQNWNSFWENQYQSWVNNTLATNVFTREDGLLAGISADCADVLYDIRIQFAFENSLPFIITAPDVLQSKMKVFGNNTNMFDNIVNERSRVRAFINYVNDEVGTENLAKDTFPIKIKSINSGVLYFVEWSLFGKPEHHSYIIKGFDQDHELQYFAGDAPRKVRKLQIDTKYPRFSFSEAPFGFRKWRHPEHLLIPIKDIPESEGYSDEQYKLLEKVGKREILKEIRRQLQNK